MCGMLDQKVPEHMKEDCPNKMLKLLRERFYFFKNLQYIQNREREREIMKMKYQRNITRKIVESYMKVDTYANKAEGCVQSATTTINQMNTELS